jgi:hypothetical protein
MPESFRSINFVQGDLGFFNYLKKQYGIFIIFVQTFTGWIFVTPIPNTRRESILNGIERMLKVSPSPF